MHWIKKFGKQNRWISIDKFKTTPTDFSELINVVDNDVVKKTVYDKLV